MTKATSAQSIREASASLAAITMAELIEAVRGDAELPATRRRDLCSAIKRFCELLAIDPATTPASPRRVRERLKAFHWRKAGISRKTFQNIRAGVEHALERYARDEVPLYGKGLADDWIELRSHVAGELRYRLSRLMGYCSALDIRAAAVDDQVIEGFGNWLAEATLVERPEALHRATIVAWNKAARTISGWPRTLLTVASNANSYSLTWNEIPAPLRKDGEAWLDRLAHIDPLDETGPIRAVRPATIDAYRYKLRQIVSALACRGRDIGTLTSLAELVEVDTAKDALRFFLERNDGKTSSQIYIIVSLLCAIAEHWVEVDGEHLARLKRLKAQLAYRSTGLTPTNRRRLRQFADPKNLKAFLGLPHQIYERVRKKNAITLADARDMQVALAIEILLMAPVRRRNLVGLDLDHHFLFEGRGLQTTVYIDFPAETVKNKVDLTFPIPKETARLLDFYIKRCLPVLQTNPGTWLFPGEVPGRHKSFDQFSRQFSKTIRRHTGLEMNLHLMRHLGAKLYLDENPGAYEVMRRVLGHKRMSTTVNNYTGLETEAAIRHFDAVILGIRGGILREAGDD